MSDSIRPVAVLNNYSRRYPHAWTVMEKFRTSKGTFADWPDWCWVPVAGAFAVVSNGQDDFPLSVAPDIAAIHALAAWRLSQGIYRFEPDIYEEIASTPLAKEVPIERLFHLPEWCVYIEAGGQERSSCNGFWACLESDANDRSMELRLVLDLDDGVTCLSVHLLPGATLADCLADSMELSAIQAIKHNVIPGTADTLEEYRNMGRSAAKSVARFVNLVLYLCSDQPDLDREVVHARPSKTKHGMRWFPAAKPKIIEAGFRTARWLKMAREKAQSQGGTRENEGLKVTPHIRRAHWHGFWSGPISIPEERKFSLRWLPQLPVGFSSTDFDGLLPTVKSVR